MNATPMLPGARRLSSPASAERRAGVMSSVAADVSAVAMEAFWQKGQARLQPKLPTERMKLPGCKWYSGFFSIGSSASEVKRP